MTKFRNQYRIESHRKPEWDYSSSGAYFITICIDEMKCILGDVINSEMVLNELGKTVQAELIKSVNIRKELQLGEFVVMPNHVHMIAILNNNADAGHPAHPAHPAETDCRPSVQGRASVQYAMPYLRPKSISSFVAGFKSAVVRAIDDYIDVQQLDIPKYNRYHKFWQGNYHDRIIRDTEEFYRITQYILENPSKWEQNKAQK